MKLLLLLLLLFLCSDSSEFQGAVVTFHPLKTLQDGSLEMEIRHRTNFKTCTSVNLSCPPEGCLTVSYNNTVIDHVNGLFCQMESVWTRRGLSNAPFQLGFGTYQWSSPTVNGVVNATFSTLVDLRNRSDSEKPNSSPQTAVLPVFRVPWNCPRSVRLLSFDPDGDLVQCRFADKSRDPSECEQCTPPSVLSLSPPCSLSFSASSSAQGLYAVQMVMEDFPRTDLVLTQTDGTKETKRASQSLSKIPVQFLLSVDSAAPSCSSGLYLPRFVLPTPEHEAQLYVQVNDTLLINIEAQASKSTVSELVFSGPSRMTQSGSGGRYVLSWSPVDSEDGQKHPVCFSVHALLSGASFSSELRCVIVNVGKAPEVFKVFTNVRMFTSANLSDEAVKNALVQEIRKELARRGLPANFTLSANITKRP